MKATLSAAIVIALVVAGMLVLERTTANVPSGLLLVDGKLTDAQKEALGQMQDLVTLLMNWSVGVIGASAFFLKLTVEEGIAIRRADLLLVLAIILFSVVSLFLGHLVIDHSAQMLSLDQFPLNDAEVRMFGRYQYLAGLGSIALFGFHVFQFFWNRLPAVAPRAADRPTAAISAILLIVASGAPSAVSAATVRFEATGPSLAQAKIRENYTFIGLVGDHINLADGMHQIVIEDPRRYELTLTFSLTGGKPGPIESTTTPDNCVPERRVRWQTPRFAVDPALPGVLLVRLTDPEYGEEIGRRGCTQNSMAACTTQRVALTVSSSPPGAEIWINGMRQEYKTDTALSLPFCTYEKTKQLLLRLPGTVNCQRSITLSPDSKVSVACTLEKKGT